MSSLLSAHVRSPRPRAVSHGGLGGFVQVDQLIYDAHCSKSSWPKGRNKRPPPINIGFDGGMGLTAISAISLDLQGCRTPVTPYTPYRPNASPAIMTTIPDSHCLPLSRYNMARRPCVCASVQETPSAPNQKFIPQPVELPGSLLLPSQGFPQSEPPVTPPRQIYERHCSDDAISTRCSTPGLSTCSTLSSGNMDVLKAFSPKKKAAKSTTSSTSNQSFSKIGKPFSAMTAEELIHCLPECSPVVIANLWVPAMVREHEKIKVLLQDAAFVKMDANVELKEFKTEMESISSDSQKISATYEHALQRAESLSERDIDALREKLTNAEMDLNQALTVIDAQRDEVIQKEEVIMSLHQTTDAIVKILGAFVEDTLPYSSLDHDRVHEVMQLLADYSSPTAHPLSPASPPLSYLRIPEQSFYDHIQTVTGLKARVKEYEDLAKSQDDTIKAHSAILDRHVSEYEKCVKVIKERDHEVLLLVEESKVLKATINSYESGQRISEVGEVEQHQMAKQLEDTERIVQRLQGAHSRELEQRDAEIANLRQKLGNAWEEVLARKKDVKHVISQTQALLAPPELNEVSPNTLSGKERKLPGKNQSKHATIGTSRSTMSLNLSEPMHVDIAPGPRSAVDPIMSHNKLRAHMEPRSPRTDDQGWGCGIAKKRSVPELGKRGDQITELRPQPRNDSLGAMRGIRRNNDLEFLEKIVKSSVRENHSARVSISTEKALPTPPDVHSEYGSIHNSDGGHSVTEEVLQDLLSAPEVPDHGSFTAPAAAGPLSPRRRVLSGITEMSVEDAESEKDTLSATSSERDMYKKSIDALNLIEFMRESDMRFAPDYEGNGYGPMEIGEANGRHGSNSTARKRNSPTDNEAEDQSTPKIVSQMYHAGRSSTAWRNSNVQP